jgi:hypothetical protein
VYGIGGVLSGRVGDDERLDAAVQLGGEDVVALVDVLGGKRCVTSSLGLR